MDITAGQEFRVKFPFVADVFSGHDVDGPYQEDTWRPGVRSIDVYPDDSEFVADAEGEMILTVVDIYKPGKYPERVFYTRSWVDPDGKEFGKGKLFIATTPTFKRRASGYYHPYRVEAA